MKKKGSKNSKPDNVVGLPVKNKRINIKNKVYTCACGGQLFALLESGQMMCSSCRTRDKKLSFTFAVPE